LIELYGKPQGLRLDNGSELTSIAFTEWCFWRQRSERHARSVRRPQCKWSNDSATSRGLRWESALLNSQECRCNHL